MDNVTTSKYQLRRMFLLNAGTNKALPSNRITVVDPRGGALVTGPNGVGKTMTLRLLPLFFGFSPNRLVGDDSNRGGMVPFILPEESSAIAFEYQRGDESELRLAVMRREPSDSRSPFYRIFNCGWDQSLFVRDGLFITDEESKSQASVKYSKKFTVAEYRSVILRTAIHTKDRSIRAFQADYSFAPVPLDNLDKLIAAMVKDSVSFDDITAVAVSRAQQNLGRAGESGRLPFRQKQSDLQAWLKTNRACQMVIEQKAKVDELRNWMSRYNAAENDKRALWWDVSTLMGKKESLNHLKRQELGDARTAWESECQYAAQVLDQLQGSVASAGERFTEVAGNLNELSRTREWFERENVTHWAALQSELPTLKQQKATLADQVAIASQGQEEAIRQYETLRNDARLAHNKLIGTLEASKSAPNSIYQTTCEGIDASAAEQANSLRVEVEVIQDDIQQLVTQKREEFGRLDERVSNPAVSQEALNASGEANSTLQELHNRLNDAQETKAQALAAFQQAQEAFTRQESTITAHRQRLADCEANFSKAQSMLAPEKDSLLYALRAHPSDAWKRDLATVLDPNLLHRSDLEPLFVEEGGSLFGWALDTSKITLPAWTEDAALRDGLARADEERAAAQQQLHSSEQDLARIGNEHKISNDDLANANAAIQILGGQIKAQRQVLDRANEAVRVERDEGVSLAKAAKEAILKDINQLQAQIAASKKKLSVDLAAIEDRRTQQRRIALQRRDEAVAQISQSITNAEKELGETLKAISEQERTHLSEQGIDVGTLNTVRAKINDLAARISAIENRDAVIKAWREYTESAGETRYEQFRLQVNSAKTAHESAQTALSSHQRNWDARTKEMKSTLQSMEEVIDVLSTETSKLQLLLESIGPRPAFVLSTVDTSATYEQMKGRQSTIQSQLLEAERGLQNSFGALERVLCSADTQLAKFITDWMGERVSPEASIHTRAMELIHCYSSIGPQFIRPANQTLRSFLTNISSLQSAISEFESEVRSVNARLQAGLSQVRCFERIQDLTLNIQPTFEDLGFYKMLKRMSEAIRNYSLNQAAMDDTLPAPADITAAVAEFASVLGNDGNLDVDLSKHITLSGSVRDNGTLKEFKRDSQLAGISSNGLSAILRITLVAAIINTMRGSAPIYVPWVTDEIATFDGPNLRALMQMLAENRIDVITAAPDLDPLLHPLFAQRYLFQDRGRIRERHVAPDQSTQALEEGSAA